MTVRELDTRIGSDELTHWIAYYRLEPWGDERADLRSAIIASTVANQNVGKGKRPYTPEQFIPKFRARTPDDPKLMAARMAQIAERVNRKHGKGT